MCLNLIGSQYKSISEVEYLLNNDIKEKQIIGAKNNRQEIERLIQVAEGYEYIDALGI